MDIKNLDITETLSISLDEIGRIPDRNPHDKQAVFLFTPDPTTLDDHWHIELDKAAAKKLHKWLSENMEDLA